MVQNVIRLTNENEWTRHRGSGITFQAFKTADSIVKGKIWVALRFKFMKF